MIRWDLKILMTVLWVLMLQDITSLRSEIHFIRSKQLLHSQAALNPPTHLRHQLSAYSWFWHKKKTEYLVQPLTSTHTAFTLKLQINDLEYNLNVDTGSSDLWIKGQSARGTPTQKYTCDCDYENQRDEHYSLGYLDGQIQTYVQNVQIDFNGSSIKTEALIAYQIVEQFLDVEGIVGLSYSDKAVHQPTFIDSLIKNNVIERYAYGFNLNLVQQNRSFITFGDPDPQLYQGDLHYYNLTSKDSLKIYFDSIKIGKNGQQLSISCAILDTGNTCISIPKQYQSQILQAFKTKNNKCLFFTQPNIDTFQLLQCKIGNFSELPTLYLQIQNQNYQIKPQFYLQNCLKHDNYHYCQTYIQTVDVWWQKDTIFLGDGFFNRFYAFFDLEEHRVAIAKNLEDIKLDDIFAIDAGGYYEDDWVGL